MRRLFIFIFLVLYSSVFCQQNDLSLNEAINIALKNNPDIIKGKQKIEAANSKFTNGISLPQPNISLSYEYIPDGTGLKNYGERTFEFNQSFEFPTRYFLKGSRLNKDIQIAESDFELSELNLIGKIKSAYYKVVRKISGLKIAGENLQIAEDFRVKSQIRYDVGEGTNLELMTAKVLKTEADNNIETVKYELKIAVSELQLVMGFPEKNEFEYNLTDSLFYKKYNFTLESLLESATYNNPKLKIADLSINASSIEKSLAWQSLLPNLNISYYRQALTGNPDYYGVSFGISLPLWFMFDHNGKIQEANVNMKIAESEKKSLYNNIMTELKNDYLDFRNKERELLLYQNEILAQTEEMYRTAKVSYEQGEANYLLLLEAKQTLINAKNNYFNSLYLYNLAFIELEQSTGKLIENSN